MVSPSSRLGTHSLESWDVTDWWAVKDSSPSARDQLEQKSIGQHRAWTGSNLTLPGQASGKRIGGKWQFSEEDQLEFERDTKQRHESLLVARSLCHDTKLR